MFDLISIGDATIDNTFKIHDAHVACNVDRTNCQLSVTYGDKIVAEDFHQMVAGNAANNAVGSSRLKIKTAAYINVGDDFNGKNISEKLKEEKVSTQYVVVNKKMNSNASSIISFQGERTIFAYHQPWIYSLPDLEKTKWVYYTSVSPSYVNSNLVNEIVSFIERSGAKLFYNPGTHQLKHGVKKNPRLLSLTEIIIINREEAKRILGINEEEDIPMKKLLKGLANLGPRMVVITNSKEGSFGYDGEKYYKLATFPAKILETTGAGDSYATGVLAGLLHGNTLPEAMRWGTANSASVVEHIGPQEGLLTYTQMQERLKSNSKIICKEI
jgi:sugar/nucleoside kinase (ribokinase family)